MPRTLWITEVDLDVGVQTEAFVIRHFFAAIPGQRLVEFSRQFVSMPDECIDHRLGVFARYPNQRTLKAILPKGNGSIERSPKPTERGSEKT